MSAAYVREHLRGDILGVVFGVLLSAIGLAGAALYRLRARSQEPLLLWLSCFSGIYGLRLLAVTGVVPLLADPIPRSFWNYLAAGFSYAILVPVILFFRELFRSFRPLLRGLLLIQAVFAVLGIAADLIFHRPDSLALANRMDVLAIFLVLGTIVFRQRGARIHLPLKIGMICFGAGVMVTNFAGLAGFRISNQYEALGFVAVLAALAWIAAKTAVEKEERLIAVNNELEVARRIQLSILPTVLPPTQALQVAVRYSPMTDVAGDFYDFLVMDERHVGILVADVAGHGVPAALIASMVKMAIAAQLPHADDPARVMVGMNQTLYGKLQGQFVTAAYLYLDLEKKSMRYSAAGHPPMLWLHRENGDVEAVEENGLLLGILKSSVYASAEKQITPGDRLLLYTDGVIEASNRAEEFFGDQRLRDTFASARPLGAEQCVGSLFTALSNWSGRAVQDDDITAIVIDVGV